MNRKQNDALQKLALVSCNYKNPVSALEMLYDLTNALGLEILETWLEWKKELTEVRMSFHHDPNTELIGKVVSSKLEDGCLTIIINVKEKKE